MSTWNLRTPPCSEAGSLQKWVFKIRSHWIGVGPESSDWWCLHKKRTGHTQRRAQVSPCDNKDRSRSEATTNQDPLRTASNYQKLGERHRTGRSPEPPEGAQAAYTFVSKFWPLNRERRNSPCFKATRFVVIRYGCPGNSIFQLYLTRR